MGSILTEQERIRNIERNMFLSDFEESHGINKVGSKSKYLRTLHIMPAKISDVPRSRLDIFAVWDDTDKCPSIKTLKTFESDKFVDSDGKVWQHFGIIPKCFKCNLYRQEKCRGYFYNYFCVKNDYNRYEGKEQKLPPKLYVTNKFLLDWLMSGKGSILKDGQISNTYSYDISKEYDFVSKDVKIKKLGSDEWVEPILPNM